MGPVTINIPKRPKFSWDLKWAPWTDCVGAQVGHAYAVRQWCWFHDSLASNNLNRIDPASCGIVLEARLYERAKDLVKTLCLEQIQEEDRAEQIISRVYQHDALSVLHNVYHEFTLFLNTRRGHDETLCGF